MVSHSYATDAQTKAKDLVSAILAAASPPEIAAACASVEAFLNQHTPDQARWFFSITFPTLICKLFGFEDSPPQKSVPPSGWIDAASSSGDSNFSGKVFNLLSPDSVLMSSISAVDRLSLVKYVFPIERLPDWVKFMLQNDRDARLLEDLCPLFKNRVKEDSAKGSFQVELNVLEYYMFWFAYCPVCRGNSEKRSIIRVQRSKRFRLENWAHSIPGFSNVKRGKEQKNECNLYTRLLYSYLRAFVPVHDINAHQPYRSSLLHYPSGYDTSVVEHTEFFVCTLVHFWLVDKDFSPLPVNVCKSFGVNFPFRAVLSETPPTPGLGEVVNLFVKYLNLSSIGLNEGSDLVESTGSPRWRGSGSVANVKSRDAMQGVSGVRSGSAWNSLIKRPLYRYILKTFLFCPVETSMKNVSQVFLLWVNYMEPWAISLEDFAEFDANVGASTDNSKKGSTESPSPGYSSSWQGFVLTNYLFYSSMVMHFVGFAHKFLHTDPEVIVHMVSKIINILTSSLELTELIKNVDTVFHSRPSGSSKSLLNNLYRFVPAAREQLQDWEDGLSESDADGSFLHENWNRDLRLFSDGEDGGQQLLQLFLLRAESELQAIGGDNLAHNLRCLDSLKAQIGCLFSGSILKSGSELAEARHCKQSRDDVFKPRMVGNYAMADVKYKGDWMKRPISNDEVAWLAKLLVALSAWLNDTLGLNQGESSHASPSWSYTEVSGDTGDVCGPTETIRVVLCSISTWLITVGGAAVDFMRKHGLRINLRMLASKKVVTVLLVVAAFNALGKAFSGLN
ncbi:hypothetical protein RJ639_028092 [Escallonia herrerae]|uniref:Sphingomyelin phosphodiesterase 4 n=1 Tax=Escallonia herrerae TaxID=1293975 RepID=A0AA89BES6_9ASTE|nr:hypothetical protein RJ639_028092 [Escallonia herrerae]